MVIRYEFHEGLGHLKFIVCDECRYEEHYYGFLPRGWTQDWMGRVYHCPECVKAAENREADA